MAGSLFLLLCFVQGGQALLRQETENKAFASAVVTAIDRKWDLTFFALILFVGMLSVAFPRFFFTSFGGAHYLWLLILLSFVMQALFFEFYKNKDSLLGPGIYSALLNANGSLAVFLVGLLIGSFFSGSGFVFNSDGHLIWSGSLGGLEAVFSLFNICFAVFLVCNARSLGAMFLLENIDFEKVPELENKLRSVSFKYMKWGVPFLIYMLLFLVSMDGFTRAENGDVTRLTWKYLLTLNEIPGLFLALVIGLTGVIGAPFLAEKTDSKKGFWFGAAGTFLLGLTILCLAGLNNGVFYPSTMDFQSGLTIVNSSAGLSVLKGLTTFLMAMPLLLAGFVWVWRSDDPVGLLRNCWRRIAAVPEIFGLQLKLPHLFAFFATLVSVLLLKYPPAILSGPEVKTAALTVFTIGLLATAVIPAYLTAFALFLLCMLFKIVPASVIFSGFASAALWLIFSGLILGIALKSTGLGDRIAGKIAVNLEGKSYSYIIGGVVVFGILLGFIMPSAMGRIVLLIPIALALAKSFGFGEGSNGRMGIVLAATFGSSMPASAILPSNVPNMVMAGIAETIYNISPMYGEYLLLHFPILGLVKAVIIAWLVVRMFPDEPVFGGKEVKKQTPLSAGEWKLSIILVGLLVLWFTDFIHHISPAWVALAAAFLLLLPKRGLVTGKQFNEKVNYGSLFFVAGVLGLGAMVAHSGLGSILANALLGILPLKVDHPLLNYISLTLTATLTGVVTTVPGAPAVLTPLAADMATASGLPIKTLLMSQVLGFSTVIFPYQAPPLIVGMQLAGEKMAPAMKFCLILAGLTVLVLLPVNYIWWQILGWL
jgi:cytochrome bd-type quinol oxidase subunit 2/di/tricarboxylate transporter